MRFATFLAFALMSLGLTGCLWGRHKAPPPPVVDLSRSATNAPANKLVVTPDESVTGSIASVNGELRFVVLTFPLGQVPPLGLRMNVFRNGAIVGEIKITGPQRDDNAVADIVLGDAKKGDEVRPK
jgi:hypothetical protein